MIGSITIYRHDQSRNVGNVRYEGININHRQNY